MQRRCARTEKLRRGNEFKKSALGPSLQVSRNGRHAIGQSPTQLQHIDQTFERSGMRIRHRSLQRLSLWAERQTIAHSRVRFSTPSSFTPLLPHGRCFTSSSVNRVTRSTQAVRKELTDVDSTIYALSTAPGRAAIAIVRISGPACLEVRLRSNLHVQGT